jgi:signal transduction histidine kinase
VVRVFVAEEVLSAGVRRAWLVLAVLGLVLIVLAAVLADRLARSIVGPVERLSAAADRLGAGDLTTRVQPEGPPEIADVGVEFNRLAEQVARLLQVERESAADLSHRLRTPLAALHLDVERLPESDGREQLLDDVAEMHRVVDFVIREVRRPERHETGAVTDLVDVVVRRVAFWGALAEEQARVASVRVDDGPLPVAAAEQDLEAAIDALIGNVFSHTPDGAPYAVECRRTDGVVALVVEDGGPGWGDDTPERGRSGGGSTGLGLDIARRTAEATGGSLAIGASPLGGARVALLFGREGPAAPG